MSTFHRPILMCTEPYQALVGMHLHQNLDEVWVMVVWKWALLRLSPHLAHILKYLLFLTNKHNIHVTLCLLMRKGKYLIIKLTV
jgi:hypothetical protein